MMTDRILQIVKREYLETARSKWFVIGTIAAPVLLLGMMFIPALLVKSGGDATRCGVLDETGILLEPLREAVKTDERLASFQWIPVPPEDAGIDRIKAAVGANRYDAVLYLPSDILTGGHAQFYARGLGIATERLDNLLTDVVTRHRLVTNGLAPTLVESVTRWVVVDAFQVGEGGKVEKMEWGTIYFVTMGFVMMIYFTVAIYGVSIMNSTVQEKSNRVMEVLLSSTTPFELMVGKLVGKGAAGLTQLGAWALTGLTFVTFGGAYATFSDIDLSVIVPPAVFGWFIVFFLQGFFTMAAIYAAAGSTCNTPEEATQLQFPAVMPMLAALMLAFFVISHPDQTAGVICSFVPFLSPILMFVRILVRTPPFWQILLAIVINTATIFATIALAARIYRIGVLMYGKRPTVPEVLRWVRSS